MGNPHVSLVLFIVRVFSAAIPGLWEYNYVFLSSYNLAAATRRRKVCVESELTTRSLQLRHSSVG